MLRLSAEKGATHFPEFLDFPAEDIFCYIKMHSQAGQTEKARRAAVDHLFCQRDLIRFQQAAAGITDRQVTAGLIALQIMISHGLSPDDRGTAAYHDRVPAG